MDSLERCMVVLGGGIADRIPVVPQSFLLACRVAGYRIGDINKDAKKLAESHIMAQEKFGYDGVVIDIDDSSLAEACGARVIFRENDVAVVDEGAPVLKNLKDIYNLEVPDVKNAARLPVWLETTSILREKIGDHVMIMGRADQGPFNLACLLRGATNFMMDLIEGDPEDVAALLEYCTKVSIEFSKAQKDAGAHVTSIGESFSGQSLISPAFYRKFAFPYQKRVVEAAHEYGIPMSLHICGNTNKIVADMAKTGAKILEIDHLTEMGFARKMTGEAVLMGNVDPSNPLVFGTPDDVDEKVKHIIEGTGGWGILLSSGCAMGSNTPDENMEALIKAAEKYGTYEQIVERKTYKEVK